MADSCAPGFPMSLRNHRPRPAPSASTRASRGSGSGTAASRRPVPLTGAAPARPATTTISGVRDLRHAVEMAPGSGDAHTFLFAVTAHPGDWADVVWQLHDHIAAVEMAMVAFAPPVAAASPAPSGLAPKKCPQAPETWPAAPVHMQPEEEKKRVTWASRVTVAASSEENKAKHHDAPAVLVEAEEQKTAALITGNWGGNVKHPEAVTIEQHPVSPTPTTFDSLAADNSRESSVKHPDGETPQQCPASPTPTRPTVPAIPTVPNLATIPTIPTRPWSAPIPDPDPVALPDTNPNATTTTTTTHRFQHPHSLPPRGTDIFLSTPQARPSPSPATRPSPYDVNSWLASLPVLSDSACAPPPPATLSLRQADNNSWLASIPVLPESACAPPPLATLSLGQAGNNGEMEGRTGGRCSTPISTAAGAQTGGRMGSAGVEKKRSYAPPSTVTEAPVGLVLTSVAAGAAKTGEMPLEELEARRGGEEEEEEEW
ncbi:hypothetical protein NKR19_g4859 [Coniochaeta hoffmannii]|uniref:Uncharacterized protein n=1 Tax=Coniochaeta hoffmannii TaxID=91930 RepID=A0AA38VU65_9PEZI|nr:hypothetical protein NKR19_g4859 [Coniochaeta hoffmannii]